MNIVRIANALHITINELLNTASQAQNKQLGEEINQELLKLPQDQKRHLLVNGK